jgi:2Fe-2S ferredoxin
MKVVFVDHDGQRNIVETQGKLSVMELATANGVSEIVAECRGSCSCATCHVFVDEAWVGRLLPPGEMEADMLDAIATRRANSRLSCQIVLDDSLDGLTINLPESQY